MARRINSIEDLIDYSEDFPGSLARLIRVENHYELRIGEASFAVADRVVQSIIGLWGVDPERRLWYSMKRS